jgi:hypothetical protein
MSEDPGEPLIRESGISEAVTEHDRSSIERRPDQMSDMLAAGCDTRRASV